MSSLPPRQEGVEQQLSRILTPGDLVQEIDVTLQALPAVAPRMSREARTLAGALAGALAQVAAADSEAQVDHFHLLVYNGNVEQVRAFMEECGTTLGVDARGQHDQTALHVAVRTGNKDMVAFLLAQRASVFFEDDEGTAAVGMIPRMPERGPRCEIYKMLRDAGAPKASGEDIDYIGSMPHVCTCRDIFARLLVEKMVQCVEVEADPLLGTPPLVGDAPSTSTVVYPPDHP